MSSSLSVQPFIPGPHLFENCSEDRSTQTLGPLLLWEYYRDNFPSEIAKRLRIRGISDLALLNTYLRFHERTPIQAIDQVTKKLLSEVLIFAKEAPDKAEKLIPGLYDYFVKTIHVFNDQWFQVIEFCRNRNHLRSIDFIKKIVSKRIEIPEAYSFLRPEAFVFQDGDSPVHKYMFSVGEVTKLLELKFSPNLPNFHGETPLQMACEKPEFHKRLIGVLLKNGASPIQVTTTSDCFQRIFDHAEKPKIRMPLLKLFLKHGFRPSFVEGCPDICFKIIPRVPSEYVKQATHFFNGGKTFVRTESDAFPDHYIYGNIGEVQGHSEFRERAARTEPRIFHPFIFPLFQHLNPPVYAKLVIKWFAHNLSLKMQPEDSSYEGYNESFTVPMFSSSINYLKNLGNVFSKNEWHWIYTKISEAIFIDKINSQTKYPEKYAEELAQKIQGLSYNEPIIIGSGYDWHFLGWVFFGDFAIFVNRQRVTNHQKGEHIHIYFIPDKSLLTPDLLLKIINRYPQRITTYYNHYALVKKLKLQHIGSHLVHPQKTGNCTLANLKGLGLVIMAILYLIKFFKPTSHQHLMNNVPWVFAFNAVTPSYKILTTQVREDATNLIITEVDRLLSIVDSWDKTDRTTANDYYNVLLYAAMEFSGENFLAPTVKRLSIEYRRLIWDRIIKLSKHMEEPQIA